MPSGKNCRHDSTPPPTRAQAHPVPPPFLIAAFHQSGPFAPARSKPWRTRVGPGATGTQTTTNQDPNQPILRRRSQPHRHFIQQQDTYTK
ncbi:hypothetical protein AVEN_54230-1 [Araneus ventricosus]|uniref:Uncharacterized protein n=1 Tax=Araneus ventricosus TaxID=182803 RepID=A0A4Y2N949_ARAVE|nr:hypothetical protein AVEN_54230-1 [Araneus ventricosus]